MPKTHKFAKDLAVGDRAQITDHKSESQSQTAIAEVVAVVPSIQTYRRPVVLVTFRDARGWEIHRTYMERTTVNLVSEAEV